MSQNADPPEAKAAIEWDQTDCPLCGSSRRATLVEVSCVDPDGIEAHPAVVRCEACDLCYTNPRPSAASIGRFYPSDYGPHATRRESHPRGHLLDRWTWRLTFRCHLRRRLPRHGQGRLLDFGCGGGSFLARMRQQGWQVLGLDASGAAVERIRGQLGLPALVGTLPHPELVPESFDCITMWQSLEHVHQPLEVLRHARDLLVPGGRLIVSVPNIDGLPFRWFGPAWFGLDLPRHLTHFSPATLRRILKEAGFEVGPVRMVRQTSWLQSSARAACRERPGHSRFRLLTPRPVCRLVSWYCAVLGQSDCIQVVAEKSASRRNASSP